MPEIPNSDIPLLKEVLRRDLVSLRGKKFHMEKKRVNLYTFKYKQLLSKIQDIALLLRSITYPNTHSND